MADPRAPAFKGQWVHFVAGTYGSWLYGDPRGFRTRHHREHVDGDYKAPPAPGAHADKLAWSRRSLKQPPVTLSKRWRPLIGAAIRDRLTERGAFVLCVALSGQHIHILAKLKPRTDGRILMGRAKKHAYFEAKRVGWEGKLWARRGRILRIKDRRHQLAVYRYIRAHSKSGAWVWHWKISVAD